MAKIFDMTGLTFGRLTVIEKAPRPATGYPAGQFWRCKCSCGKEVVAYGCAMREGRRLSCGCLKADQNRKNISKVNAERRVS
jgi:hypothetical protein